MQERFYISFGLGALLENSKTFLGGGTSDYFTWSVVPMTQPWLVLEKGWMDFNVSVSLNPCVFVCCLPNMLSGVRAALVTARGLRGFWCLKWQTAFLTQGMLPLMETPTMFRVVGRCFFYIARLTVSLCFQTLECPWPGLGWRWWKGQMMLHLLNSEDF